MSSRHILLVDAQLGVAGTLSKPFDPLTLTEQIATILGRVEKTP